MRSRSAAQSSRSGRSITIIHHLLSLWAFGDTVGHGRRGLRRRSTPARLAGGSPAGGSAATPAAYARVAEAADLDRQLDAGDPAQLGERGRAALLTASVPAPVA